MTTSAATESSCVHPAVSVGPLSGKPRHPALIAHVANDAELQHLQPPRLRDVWIKVSNKWCVLIHLQRAAMLLCRGGPRLDESLRERR